MRRGFTLVELLVVIGIVAVLLALLLPGLARSRRQAERVHCLSKLRQLSAMLTMYANDNREQVPLGYRRAKQFNSMFYSATAGRFVLFGNLFLGMSRRGNVEVFYCRSESNPTFLFDTYSGLKLEAGATFPTNIQAGYSMRPEYEIPDVLDASSRLPKLRSFKNTAILADTTASFVRLDTRHRTGLNALFGDGSAFWIERKQIEPAISSLPEPAGAPNPAMNDLMDAVWAGLDRR